VVTTCTIKHFSSLGGGGTNIWIEHEGKRYYSRVNYIIQNSTGMQNLCIMEFHKRRKIYGTY
jgi:hypothetical protein